MDVRIAEPGSWSKKLEAETEEKGEDEDKEEVCGDGEAQGWLGEEEEGDNSERDNGKGERKCEGVDCQSGCTKEGDGHTTGKAESLSVR